MFIKFIKNNFPVEQVANYQQIMEIFETADIKEIVFNNRKIYGKLKSSKSFYCYRFFDIAYDNKNDNTYDIIRMSVINTASAYFKYVIQSHIEYYNKVLSFIEDNTNTSIDELTDGIVCYIDRPIKTEPVNPFTILFEYTSIIDRNQV